MERIKWNKKIDTKMETEGGFIGIWGGSQN